MSVSHKSSNTQMFRLMLYQRALHPELFPLQARRTYRQAEYEVELWLLPAGHVVRFQTPQGRCLAEAVLDQGDHLPEHGLIHALPCLGEKDYEMQPLGNIGYVTTIQTETLTENLFDATLREMRDYASEHNAMCHEWKDADAGLCLSILDSQKYKREYHIQSYHLLSNTGLVLRTQSIFEVQ